MTLRWLRFLRRTKNQCLFVWRSHQDTTWVHNMLLADVLWLTSDILLTIITVMPNKSAFPLILVRLDTIWMKLSDSLVDEALPSYRPPTPTGGKGSITQWVHGEFIVISEAICSHFTHQAHGKHFQKELPNLPTFYPAGKV